MPRSRPIDVSIVVVTFHARAITLETLANYREAIASDSENSYELIVVDNDSRDGLPAAIRRECPIARLICNPQNLGYARACNIGHAQSSGRYLLFSNPDIRVNRRTIPGLVRAMDAHRDWGACTPSLRLLGGTDLDWGCHRGLPTPWAAITYFTGLARLFRRSRRLSRLFGRYHLLEHDLDHEHSVDAIEGGFFFVRREVFEEVGGWDEDYFLFGEDVDLSHRIGQKGHALRYLPQLRAWHQLGATTGLKDREGAVLRKARDRAYHAFYDSMQLFYDKHLRNRYGPLTRQAVFLGIELKRRFGRRRVGLGRRATRRPSPRPPTIYRAIRLHQAVRNPRLKLLGALAARALRMRHLSIRLDPVIGCNIACLMCPSIPALGKGNGSLRFTNEELERLAEMFFPQALQVVVGCSYEPTVYRDFVHPLRLARSHRVPQVSFVSNGQLLTEEHLEDFCEVGLNELILSTHGVRRATYERLMHRASFDRFHRTLLSVGESKSRYGGEAPSLRINYTVCRDNLEELEDFFEVYGGYPLQTLQIRPMTGRARGVLPLQESDLPRYRRVVRGLIDHCRDRQVILLANVEDPLHRRENEMSAAFPAFFFYVDPKTVWREDFDWRVESYGEYCRRVGYARQIASLALASRAALLHASRRYADSAEYQVFL